MTCHAPAQALAPPLRCTGWFTLLAALLIFGLLADGTAFGQKGNSGNAPGQNKDKDDDDGGGDDGGDGSEPDPGVRYEFHLLDTFGAEYFNVASDLNNHGDIVGWSRVDGETHRDNLPTTTNENRAYLSSPGIQGLIPLYDLLTDEDREIWILLSVAYTITDAGQIYGRGTRWINEEQTDWESAFFLLSLGYTDDEGVETPTTIEEFVTHINAMNAFGDATGRIGSRGFFLPAGSDEPQLLPGLEDVDSTPNDINFWGDIAGSQHTDGRAFLLTADGHLQYLGVLGSGRGGTSRSAAYGLNDGAGDKGPMVVGQSTAGGWKNHAFRWQDGVMESLGTLGGNRSIARSVNNYGEIVGSSDDADGVTHPFLYLEGQGMMKLEDLLVDGPSEDSGVMEGANSNLRINDDGVIMGRTGDSGSQRSFVLTPVVEEE